jgi:hypothetical protein
MDRQPANQSRLPEKRKLSREELLAGKCAPSNDATADSDPRIKSPDDILLKKAPGGHATENVKAAPATREQVESELHRLRDRGIPAESPSVKPVQAAKPVEIDSFNFRPAPRPEVVQNLEREAYLQEINELRRRHELELSQWRTYEQSVHQWKDQVMQVFQKLNDELTAAKTAGNENAALKRSLQEKEQELINLRNLVAEYNKQSHIKMAMGRPNA